jgi:exodeoxyribonuclease V beta subunit
MKPFDLLTSPIDGANLIEAGAGTGKTYTIAGLYLRILLERNLTVEKILVVTFTEAATQELKERIRLRLKDAELCFDKGATADPFLESCMKKSSDRVRDLERLREAVRSFDQASVFTIHGFCQRMLVENAFESGALFETELVTDRSVLIREILQDFIRINMYGMDSLFADYLVSKNVGPDSLKVFMEKILKPGIRFHETSLLLDTAELEKERGSVFLRMKKKWLEEREGIVSLLFRNPQLKQNMYGENIVNTWSKSLDVFFKEDDPGIVIPQKFAKGCTTGIKSGLKKNGEQPVHSFFEDCELFKELHEELIERFNSNLVHFKRKAFDFVSEELYRRKKERGIMFFDDLLTVLHERLANDSPGLLAGRIRNTYSAALIDEFQDTDPIQYEIFSRVFGGGKTPLFMIGDPKQAIYGFRGADIFAYLNAAQSAETSFTLGKNYRSDQHLVQSVNALFENVSDPFLFPEICFHPAESDENKPPFNLTVDGGSMADGSPFTLLLLHAEEKELSKKEASLLSKNVVASEMARFVGMGTKGTARIGGEPVKPRHMAVLVQTNSEAKDVNEELNRWGIPSVIHDTGNVFQSREAEELERFLASAAYPENSGFMKAALATDMMGVDVLELVDPSKLDRWGEMFRDYHRTWIRRGFSSMYYDMARQWQVKARLMDFEDGNRRNTNLSHLAQLLHEACLEIKGGPLKLLDWFRERIARPEDIEEHQLRLEQDSEAVTIVTIHKSKGMEYPIVFLPFLWSHTEHKSGGFCVFHDDKDKRLTCDMGSEDMENHLLLAEKEELAEIGRAHV